MQAVILSMNTGVCVCVWGFAAHRPVYNYVYISFLNLVGFWYSLCRFVSEARAESPTGNRMTLLQDSRRWRHKKEDIARPQTGEDRGLDWRHNMVEEIKLKSSEITLFLLWPRLALVKEQSGNNHRPSGLSMVTAQYLFIESNKCACRHQAKVPTRGHLPGCCPIQSQCQTNKTLL